jgi:hypothetical protein
MLTLLAAPAGLFAQSFSAFGSPPSSGSAADPSGGAAQVPPATLKNSPPTPFSRLALSGGVSLTMGINMQAAVEANRYFNIRGIGNYFTYTVNNVTINKQGGSNGINVSGKLNLASAGIALDYYPFPNHGWRLSPGLMLYNQNGVSASGVSTAGSSFSLGGQKYYSDSVNPLNVNANLGLNARQQAFSMTTGWGNMISRRGGHWSFPFELGAVFTGVPAVNINLTGNACLTQADAAINGPTCEYGHRRNGSSQPGQPDRQIQERPELAPGLSHLVVWCGV